MSTDNTLQEFKTVFRKNKHGRVFYRIEPGDVVTEVEVLYESYNVWRGRNWIVFGQAIDKDMTIECSKEEFDSVYKEALTGVNIEIPFL